MRTFRFQDHRARWMPAISSHRKYSAVLLCALAFAALAGCSARSNPNVDRVRADLAILKSEPTIAAEPTIELNEAEQAVRRAEEHWAKQHDSGEAEHLAYLAGRRIDIARLKGEQRVAESNVSQLSRARDIASVSAQLSEEARATAQPAMTLGTPVLYELRIEDPLTPSSDIAVRLNSFLSDRGPRDLRITLGNQLFESGRVELKNQSAPGLSTVAAFIRNHPTTTVVLKGYSNVLGSESQDMEFSRGRALAVNRFLIGEGIHADRMVIESFGRRFPIEPNRLNASGHRQAQVDIVFLSSR